MLPRLAGQVSWVLRALDKFLGNYRITLRFTYIVALVFEWLKISFQTWVYSKDKERLRCIEAKLRIYFYEWQKPKYMTCYPKQI